jgi:hypothetical protein
MPRAVAPWTWRRALRDHGPEDPHFLLAMLVLNTFMDATGFAYPGQSTWARGARKSVRMIQRYIVRARSEGWLYVVNAGRTGRGWAHHGYRCCVPDYIKLSEKDERISDHIISTVGDVEGDDTAMSPRLTQRVDGDDTKRNKVATSGRHGGDMTSGEVATQLCRTNSGSENSHSITHAIEEAPAKAGALVREFRGREKSEEEEAREAEEYALLQAEQRFQRVTSYLRQGFSEADTVRLLQGHGIAAEEVRQIANTWRAFAD